MELSLETKIQFLKGVGPKLAEKLHKLGIETARDLIFYWPRTYQDFTQITSISDLSERITNDELRIKARNANQFDRTSYFVLRNSNIATIRARIIGIANKLTSRQRMKVTEAVVEDGTGTIKLIWFNQPFLKNMLRPGSEWIFRGQIDYNSFTNEWTMESPSWVKQPCIIPVYPTTAGLTSGYITRLITPLINRYCSNDVLGVRTINRNDRLLAPTPHRSKNIIDDFLPSDVMTKYDLLPLQDAIIKIHTPKDFDEIDAARKRLAFNELLLISLRARLSKEELSHKQAPSIKIDENEIKSFVGSLPYELTGDQKKAAWQILQDMSEGTVPPRGLSPSSRPMNRLLNGDVGSGKTVVAAITAYAVIQAGYQVALMVSTEVLATQHFETFSELFAASGISVGLMTANIKKMNSHFEEAERLRNPIIAESDGIITSPGKARIPQDDTRKKAKKAEPQKANIIIGTQALLQKSVDLKNIGLVIVDEQHRFGVKQRAALKLVVSSQQLEEKNRTADSQQLAASPSVPHFLSMTATPIPRTLHLALFGDLDISVINEKPKNRKEIKTRFVDPENRMKAYDFIRSHIKSGRQVFVVCPLIEEVDDELRITNYESRQGELFNQDRKSVMKEYDKLSKETFPEFKVAMLHGKMKSKEKEAILVDFASNKTNILVSTSVIEVGIDIPNATVMMIEDAERFGLAQIHQFRGRVGRAEHQSFCFLFSGSRSQNALIRLRSLENVSDGFKLAEIDLEMRGPGDMFGTMQSGQLELKMATFSDRILIEQASQAASEIIQNDPRLKINAGIKDRLAQFEASKHME